MIRLGIERFTANSLISGESSGRTSQTFLNLSRHNICSRKNARRACCHFSVTSADFFSSSTMRAVCDSSRSTSASVFSGCLEMKRRSMAMFEASSSVLLFTCRGIFFQWYFDYLQHPKIRYFRGHRKCLGSLRTYGLRRNDNVRT